LPHPSETATASSGRPAVSPAEYKSAVMGSPPPHAVGPQQLDLPTDRAISPYFSRTASWRCVSDIVRLPDVIGRDWVVIGSDN
jgi:hypothetical protein